MKKDPKPYEQAGWVILNPYGDVWSPRVFDDADDAMAHLDEFWSGREKWRTSRFTLAPAVATFVVTGKERVRLP